MCSLYCIILTNAGSWHEHSQKCNCVSIKRVNFFNVKYIYWNLKVFSKAIDVSNSKNWNHQSYSSLSLVTCGGGVKQFLNTNADLTILFSWDHHPWQVLIFGPLWVLCLPDTSYPNELMGLIHILNWVTKMNAYRK